MYSGFVYYITVDHTNIEQYYCFSDPVDEDLAKKVFIADMKEQDEIQYRLAELYEDEILIERLQDTEDDWPEESQVKELNTKEARELLEDE